MEKDLKVNGAEGTAKGNSDERLTLCKSGKGTGGNLSCKISVESPGSFIMRYLELNERKAFQLQQSQQSCLAYGNVAQAAWPVFGRRWI